MASLLNLISCSSPHDVEKLPHQKQPWKRTLLASNPDRSRDLEAGESESSFKCECGSDCEIEKENRNPAETDNDEYIQLVASVEDMLSGLAPRSQEYSIFRVPTKLREGNDEAYTPQVVSIGPLHRGKPELIGKEEYKMTYLKGFLDRTAMPVKRCLKLIQGWEEKVRSCYAEKVSLSSDEFVKMVLVDSGFIIESVLRYWFNEEEEGVSGLVRLDLILVENQLPFFLLDGIFHLAFTHYPSKNKNLPKFLKALVAYFKNECLIKELPEDIPSSKIKHFVDLLRIIHVPASRNWSTPKGDREYVRVQTATGLQEAGMEIKCGLSSSGKSFLDMKYNPKGVLEITKFRVTDSTESMLRNLIALEVLLYQKSSYIIDCVVFMDGLIDRAKDVDILVENGVVENYLGESEGVAKMLNDLTAHVGLDADKYYFCDLSRDVNAYCNVPSHKWMATMRQDYFSTPIKVASIIVATILVLLTLIQTVCSIISLL